MEVDFKDVDSVESKVSPNEEKKLLESEGMGLNPALRCRGGWIRPFSLKVPHAVSN